MCGGERGLGGLHRLAQGQRPWAGTTYARRRGQRPRFAVRAFVDGVVLGVCFSVDEEGFGGVAFGESAEAGVVGGWWCWLDAVDGETGVGGCGLDDGFECGGAFAVVAANEHVAVGVEVLEALGEEFLVVFADGPECGRAGGGGWGVDDDAVEHVGGVGEVVAAVGGDAGVEALVDVVEGEVFFEPFEVSAREIDAGDVGAAVG